MKRSHLLNIGLCVLALVFLAGGWYVSKENKPTRVLPVYGPLDHKVSDFQLTDQQGKSISQETLAGKIYVTDFFFTTCQSICPIMSTQMERVYDHYKGNEEIVLLSHTVNPEADSVPVLAQYAKKHHASASQWHFLTGDKQELYRLARKSYFLDAAEGNGGADDFIHTPQFVLVDKEKRIRGYYTGTDSVEVNRLITEIDLLLAEYRYKGE
jgi:protein SCO1/2